MAYELACVATFMIVVALASYYGNNNDLNDWFKSFFFILSFVFVDLGIYFGKLVANSNGANSAVLDIINISFIIMLVVTVLMVVLIVIKYLLFIIENYNVEAAEKIKDEISL